jgi:hypothetical protein
MTWNQSIGLEEPIAQTTSSHPLSLLQKPYGPPRVPRKFIRPTLMSNFSTWHLDVGAKKGIGVYSLLHHTSNKSQTAIPIILTFGPRVSLISTENFIIVFLQLLEGVIQLTMAIISFKGLLLVVKIQTKPKSDSLS